MTDTKPLTESELKELERLATAAHAALSAPGPLNQIGFQAQAAFVSAVIDHKHSLLFSARRLLLLEGALLYLKGGRSPDVYIERAKERGWSPTEEETNG